MDALKTCEIPTVETTLSPTIEKSLSDIINSEGFLKQKTFKRSISTNGGNYLGELFEVDIKGNTADGKKETYLFIKKIISGENFTLCSIADVHLREVIIYTELLPLYTELENEANIPEEERFKKIKFYDANSEALIFDNLSKKGYKTMNRKDVVSLEYAEIAITQLAKFHALSFVLEHKRPEYFNKTIRPLHNFFETGSSAEQFFDKVYDFSCSLLEGELRKKLETAKTRVIQKLRDAFSNSRRVLCHGDYRINNILYQETNGKITDLIPIDYQIIYYGNPVNDFMYFILPSSDQEFRRKYLIHLKDLYYEELSNYLNKLHIEVETVYPRKDFEKEFVQKYEYGLMCSINIIPLLFPKEGDILDVDQDVSEMKFSVEDEAKVRIQGIVEDYIRWGYL